MTNIPVLQHFEEQLIETRTLIMSALNFFQFSRGTGTAAVAILACVAASGCTVVPGLHVDESSRPSGYEVQPEVDGLGYKVSDASSGFSYRVVEIDAKTIGQIEAESSNAQMPTQLGSITPGAIPDTYILGPGDIVSVVVWEHPELTNATGEFRDAVSSGRLISTTGELFYPYVGSFKASGMTVEEARQYITNGLSRVIKDPQVDLRVVAFRARRVQVTGAVNAPGIVNLDDTPKGILDAISERGGISDIASRRRIELIRGGHTYELDERQIVAGHSPILNPPLKPGDIINIPDRSADQVFILGAVATQGAIYLQQSDSTLTEALADSKGLDSLRADDSGVLVFREGHGASDPTVYVLNMSSPVGLLLAGQFNLEPRDVVYVKATGFAKYNSVIGQLLPTITAIYQLHRL